MCKTYNLRVAELMMANGTALEDETRSTDSSGAPCKRCRAGQARRHPARRPQRASPCRWLHRSLQELNKPNVIGSTWSAMEWVNLFALAVNEENAAGGRMVTAPTNGVAGIIPAVLHYFMKFSDEVTEANVVDYLLSAAAVGILCKKNGIDLRC